MYSDKCFGKVAIKLSIAHHLDAITRWLVAGCHDNSVHLWVPAEDLEHFGVRTEDLTARRPTQELGELVRFENFWETDAEGNSRFRAAAELVLAAPAGVGGEGS